MAKHYPFKDESDSELLTDGTFYTDKMGMDYEYAILHILTVDSSGDPATATAGTATVSFADRNGQYDLTVADGDNPVDLTLCGEVGTYEKALYLGDAKLAKIEISGLTGADNVKAYLRRG